MAAQFKQGMVIFRRWNVEDGLNEISKPFQSIDELFGLCLQTDNSLLIDRVVINGEDSTGIMRSVTLVFQSSSMQDESGE
jgi:hypothetical protein